MYHRKHKYDIIIVLAVLALAVSLYLAVSSALGIKVPCSITKGCEAVLNSKYSKFFGFPVSYWGVGFFGLVILIALLANHYRRFQKILTLFSGAGALGALGFLLLQFFVIGSICQYCIVVDILAITIFIWDLNIEHISLTTI